MASSRFVLLDDDDLSDFCIKKNAKNTDRATNFGMKLLKLFAKEVGISDTELDNLSNDALNNLLKRFYTGVRTTKGEYYKVNSMRSIRFSVQRYFMQLSDFDIITCQDFHTSNLCFENLLKILTKSGKGNTDHHPEIEPEDIKKLYSSFDINNPIGLQEKVWLDVMMHLIRRGRENLRMMNKDTFLIGKDATGRRFVHQSTSEMDKNHGISDNDCDTIGEGRIYETGGSSCPVKTFEAYISHLHPLEFSFWQRPLERYDQNKQVWYYRAPLGEKSLGNMMAKMSVKYGLSERYTNHSLRVTSLQVLDDNNIEGRHAIRVSGHKSTDSINSYARRLSASRKRNISGLISAHLSRPPTFDLIPNMDMSPSTANPPSFSNTTTTKVKVDAPAYIKPKVNNNSVHFDKEPSSTTSRTVSEKKTSSPNNRASLKTLEIFNDNDDDLFTNIPSDLLNPFTQSAFHPIFSNCSNCTINFNVNIHPK